MSFSAIQELEALLTTGRITFNAGVLITLTGVIISLLTALLEDESKVVKSFTTVGLVTLFLGIGVMMTGTYKTANVNKEAPITVEKELKKKYKIESVEFMREADQWLPLALNGSLAEIEITSGGDSFTCILDVHDLTLFPIGVKDEVNPKECLGNGSY